MNRFFKLNDLSKADKQYRYTFELKDFKIGEKVFLKSNPELPLIVVENNTDFEVTCINPITGDTYNFSPSTLMKYEYAAMILFKGIKMCLN